MNRLPSDPVSVALIGDGADVFLSFHFETENITDAKNLTRQLEFWLQLFLEMQNLTPVKIDLEDLNGQEY